MARRSASELAYDRKRIAELAVKGYTQMRIVACLDADYKAQGNPRTANQSDVSKKLKDQREIWAKEEKLDTAQHIDQQMRELDDIKSDAADSFKRSIQPHPKTRIVETTTAEGETKGADGKPIVVSKTTTVTMIEEDTPIGEAAFLNVKIKALDTQGKILGLHDKGLKLDPETVALIEMLGLDMKAVSAALNGVLKEYAKNQGA